jgi:signal transduction histidine kinase
MARIVLIDDEARLLRTLARFLELQGHTVICGEGFAQVADHVWPGRFEVLVTDIVMPDMDGMSVLQEVASVRKCQEPVLLITGDPNLETAAEAVRRGAFDYITKPVTKDRLQEAVLRGLRHVQLVRERDQARRTEMELLRNLALLGEQASVLSHEIRTPITSLRHALGAVAERIGMEDRVLVEALIANIERIEQMLNQTLSFARPLRLERKPTELAPLLAHVAEQVSALPTMKGMAIDIRCAPTMPPLDLDPQLFGEVLVNLLRNAGEACSGRGRVEIAAGVEAGRPRIAVTDSGPGVPADLRDEIFKPFYSRKQGGTGLGLAVCRKIVESHGGSIELAARPGPGASFRIDLDPNVVLHTEETGK